MSILDEMYYGELADPQRPAVYWQEMRNVDQRISHLYGKLLPELNDEQRKLCDEIERLLTEKSMIDARYSFRTGFRLAARIFADSFASET